VRRTAVVLLAVASLAGCVHHPGLPATGTSGFEAKAATTAAAAISVVSTVRLALDSEAAGNTTRRYLAATVGDQEDRLEEVVSSFSAVTPPTDEARALRTEVVAALGSATDHVASVRIALGAGEDEAALALRPDLADDAEALAGFES
jgi:hypothetical protein